MKKYCLEEWNKIEPKKYFKDFEAKIKLCKQINGERLNEYNLKEIRKKGEKIEKEKDIQTYLSRELHTTPLLTLGDWKIFSGTADSDDGYIDRFLYNSLDYDSEYFKKGSE